MGKKHAFAYFLLLLSSNCCKNWTRPTNRKYFVLKIRILEIFPFLSLSSFQKKLKKRDQLSIDLSHFKTSNWKYSNRIIKTYYNFEFRIKSDSRLNSYYVFIFLVSFAPATPSTLFFFHFGERLAKYNFRFHTYSLKLLQTTSKTNLQDIYETGYGSIWAKRSPRFEYLRTRTSFGRYIRWYLLKYSKLIVPAHTSAYRTSSQIPSIRPVYLIRDNLSRKSDRLINERGKCAAEEIFHEIREMHRALSSLTSLFAHTTT